MLTPSKVWIKYKNNGSNLPDVGIMKRFIHALFIPFLLSTQGVFADVDSGVFGSEKMADPQEEAGRPFSLSVSYDQVCRSNFSKKGLKKQSQWFSIAEIEAGGVFYHNPCYDEGGKATIGYSNTRFDWKENPFFRQKQFNVVSFELGFATKRITNWLWQANLSMNVDGNRFNVRHYSNYDLLFWGRYSITPNIGYHAGFLAFTGMHVNKLWPIFGFDWTFSKKWKLNLVYPVNISLVYQINPCFSASLAGRAFFNRYRAGEHEPLPQAIFEYRNTGAEFALNYEWNSRLKLNGHVGHTFGGQVWISNRSHNRINHLDINGAGYFGGSVVWDF